MRNMFAGDGFSGMGVRAAVLVLAVGCLAGCGPEAAVGPRPLAEVAPPVVDGYAKIVAATYKDVLAGATAMNASVDAFVKAPAGATLSDARLAWREARHPYALSEAFRFYGGPIDDIDGPEPRINAWPLDEAYIDYVDGDPNAGVINDPTTYPMIDQPLLISLNEKGGEKNIAAGYHAIEFLLWGQDKNPNGPGDRPFTDYVVGAGGTAANQDRRATYLRMTGDLLIADFTPVVGEWAEAGAYRTSFVKLPPEQSLQHILLGMGSLSGAELAGERMQVAYDTKEQEDEHSCFSDNTIADLADDARSIQNVYLGKYGALDVPGLDEIVRERDPDLDQRMQQQLAASIAAIEAIPQPFDQAMQGADSSEGRMRIAAAIQALRTQTSTIVEVATLLGISLNIEK